MHWGGVLSDYDLDGWSIWRIDGSGFLGEYMEDRTADARISQAEYSTYVAGASMILVPKLTEKTTEPLSVTITIGDQSWSAFSFDGSYNRTYSSEQTASISTSPADGEIVCQYYLAQGDESYTSDELDGLSWSDYGGGIPLTSGKYVLYAKAQNIAENAVYASTEGLVVDGAAPVISGITDGSVYEGDTSFTVSDANLESVTVDGQEVSLTNNSYTIVADNQTHRIVARNKAGYETVCEITVNKKAITGNEITDGGTYTLTAGTAYRLGDGKWKVSGDDTVYEGGSTFYVSAGGEYSFQKQ